MASRLVLLICCLLWTRTFAFVPVPTVAQEWSQKYNSALDGSIRSSIEDEQNMLQRIQRSYSRWEWEHRDNIYNINYRVEGPETAPPLLLVHGFGVRVVVCGFSTSET